MNSFKKITMILAVLIIIVITTFYLIIGIGLSSRLQTLWVTTAMTTMNHKWLATSIISQERIDEIMKENYVDDSEYNSEIIEISTQEEHEENTEVDIDKYDDEGYVKLEDGIYLKPVKDKTWRGFIMLVQDPLRVKLVDTPKQFERGWTVKKMVDSVEGIAGINGGGFQDGPNYNSNGGLPEGLIISDGKLINPRKFNSMKYNMIGINKEGVLVLRHCTAEWAIENGIQHAISFSPYIIVNGEGTIKKGNGGWGIAPRTALGQRETGEILFLVIDGRQPTWSVGVDLKVLQEVLLKEKCINAAMLDGGSSTVMVYNGEFINKPSLGHERYINNAWVVQ